MTVVEVEFLRRANTAEMFFDMDTFNPELSNWDVSRVTDMCAMFNDATSFNQTLCGAAWINSKASKVDMFTR